LIKTPRRTSPPSKRTRSSNRRTSHEETNTFDATVFFTLNIRIHQHHGPGRKLIDDAATATTEKKPKITDINGDRMVDNYFWLREKSNPAVIAHLEAENAYGAALMKPTEGLQEKLLQRDSQSHQTN